MKQSVIGIVKTDEKVVLVKRRDVPVWVLPGGGVDGGESPEEAVVREVLEETGLTVKILRKTAEYTPINRLCLLTHVYECTPLSGKLTLTDETRSIQAFQLTELPETFLVVHKEWLGDAQKNLPFIIKEDIKSVTYFAVIKYFFRHPIQVLRALLSRFGCPINSR